jgi:hypothetical protein
MSGVRGGNASLPFEPIHSVWREGEMQGRNIQRLQIFSELRTKGATRSAPVAR